MRYDLRKFGCEPEIFWSHIGPTYGCMAVGSLVKGRIHFDEIKDLAVILKPTARFQALWIKVA
jgi:hypothetical protein